MMRRATCSILAAVLLGAVAVRGQGVVCDGTGLAIESGLWGVSGATLQDRTPLASGGPNLMLNGDFTYAQDGTNENGDNVHLGLVTDSWAGQLETPIKNWPASGGGTSTYAIWGGYVRRCDPAGGGYYTGYCVGWNPVALAAGASPSMVYFGNSVDWGWNRISGSTASFSFDSNGYRHSDDLFFITPNAGQWGTNATPVTVSQTVTGLTPGRRYRLQYFQGSESYNQAVPNEPGIGIAAIDITGYERFYMSISGRDPKYRTVDFIAKSASTTISFMSWGHVAILFAQNSPNCTPFDTYKGTESCASELALDDVILTQCQNPLPKCDKNNKYATGASRPSGKVAPGKPITYTAMLSSKIAGRKTALQNVVFSMPLPDGVTLKAATAGKNGGAASVSPDDVLTLNIGTVKAGGRVKVTLKLTAPSKCSTPAPLGLQGEFTYTAGGSTKTAVVCPKKPLYVWQKGCDAIPKASGHNKL